MSAARCAGAAAAARPRGSGRGSRPSRCAGSELEAQARAAPRRARQCSASHSGGRPRPAAGASRRRFTRLPLRGMHARLPRNLQRMRRPQPGGRGAWVRCIGCGASPCRRRSAPLTHDLPLDFLILDGLGQLQVVGLLSLREERLRVGGKGRRGAHNTTALICDLAPLALISSIAAWTTGDVAPGMKLGMGGGAVPTASALLTVSPICCCKLLLSRRPLCRCVGAL